MDVITIEEHSDEVKHEASNDELMLFPSISHVSQITEEEAKHAPNTTVPSCVVVHPVTIATDVELPKIEKGSLIEGFDVLIKQIKVEVKSRTKESHETVSDVICSKDSDDVTVLNGETGHSSGYQLRKRKNTGDSVKKRKRRKSDAPGKPDVAAKEVTVQPVKALDDNGHQTTTWCEKFRPKCENDIAGNSLAVLTLHQWLSSWVRKSKHKSNNEKLELKSKNKNSLIEIDDDYEDEDNEDDEIPRCALIYGPPGVGKTSMVYTIAEQLQFKVFEVNASSRRTGKQLLHHFQEATQSHHVRVDPNSNPLLSMFQRIEQKTPKKVTEKIKASTKSATKADETPKKGSIQYFFNNQQQKQKNQLEKDKADGNAALAKEEMETKKQCTKKTSDQMTISSMFKRINASEAKDSSTKNAKDKESKQQMENSLEDKEVSTVNSRKGKTVKNGSKEVKDSPQHKIPDSKISKTMEKKLAAETEIPKNQESRKKTGNGSEAKSSNTKNSQKSKTTKTVGKEQDKEPDIEIISASKKNSTKKQDAKMVSENEDCLDVVHEGGVGISSLSLILLDDVDVIFDNDDGFWPAVNTLIETTKKPIVLTANRNISQVRSAIKTYFKEIKVDQPISSEVSKLIERICEQEKLQVNLPDVKFLIDWFNGDVRRCLYQLQFWASRIGGDQNDVKPQDVVPSVMRSVIGIDSLSGVFSRDGELDKSCDQNLACKINGFNAMHKCLPQVLDRIPSGQSQNASEIGKNSFSPKSSSKTTLQSVADLVDTLSLSDVMTTSVSNSWEGSLCPEEHLRHWMTSMPDKSDIQHVNNTSTNFVDLVSSVEVLSARNTLNKLLPGETPISGLDSYVCENMDTSKQRNIEKTCKEVSDVLAAIHMPSLRRIGFEYYSMFRDVCKLESIRKMKNETRTRRFHHYLDHLAFPLDPHVINELSKQMLS